MMPPDTRQLCIIIYQQKSKSMSVTGSSLLGRRAYEVHLSSDGGGLPPPTCTFGLVATCTLGHIQGWHHVTQEIGIATQQGFKQGDSWASPSHMLALIIIVSQASTCISRNFYGWLLRLALIHVPTYIHTHIHCP